MGTLQYVSIAENTFDFNLLLCWVPFSWDHDKFIIKEKKQKHDVVIITYVKYFCFLQRDQNWWCFHWDRRRSSCSLSSEFSSEISLMRCVIHLLLFDSQWLAGCRPACWSREVAGHNLIAGHTTWLLVSHWASTILSLEDLPACHSASRYLKAATAALLVVVSAAADWPPAAPGVCCEGSMVEAAADVAAAPSGAPAAAAAAAAVCRSGHFFSCPSLL